MTAITAVLQCTGDYMSAMNGLGTCAVQYEFYLWQQFLNCKPIHSTLVSYSTLVSLNCLLNAYFLTIDTTTLADTYQW